MKLKNLLIAVAVAIILTIASALVRGFPARFLRPIFTIQLTMVGAPHPLFPFRILFLPLLADFLFFFFLSFLTCQLIGSKLPNWLKALSLVTIVALMIFGLWQRGLHQKLFAKMSCGGDWSYLNKCPYGSYCRSLKQGPLAGGLCKAWLTPLFEFLSI
jgi:hypothetical protein